MFFEVRHYDSKGTLMKITGGKELTLAHWGADNVCKGCGLVFKIAKKTTKKRLNQVENAKQYFVPNLVPEGEYCNQRCRYKNMHSNRLKNGKVDYGDTVCDVCSKRVIKKTYQQKRHKGECQKEANRISNRRREKERSIILKAQKLQNSLNNPRGLNDAS